MVRMAQNFSIRHMLVDGHGNFGSVDGDGAAAMRYTEARMSKITMELLRDIDKDTVDFYPNFDETLEQPTVLPARFPNLLVNGTGGIAVGMATNIPPHNLGEVIDATIALIDDPDITIEGLIEHLPGPDFPTGGIVRGVSGIREAYTTGRGRIRVRARAEIEPLGESREQIIVTEIPYQVNKASLVEKIAELVREKRLEGISDLRDESDKSGMRIVIELKRGANANVVLNRLYKHTQMQDTFGVIMIALVDSEPRVLNLKEVLYYYIEHQKDVLIRRTRFELEKARKRAHILEGLIIALDNIDRIVELIKKSPDPVTARAALMENFGLSEIQAQAILDMRLQRLTGLERDKILAEYEEIQKTIAHLEAILSNPQMVLDIIKEDLTEIRRKYADDRRTEITFVEDEIDLDELIEREEMVVTLTHFGYIKRLSLENYRSQKRGGKGITALSTREEDFVENIFVTSTHNQILYFTNLGKVYMQKGYQIPEAGRQAKGTAIVNLLNLDAGEKISAVFPVSEFDQQANLVMVTRGGVIKKTEMSAYANIRQNGLIAVGLREGDELIAVLKTDGEQNIIVGTRQGMSITFNEKDVRPMGRTATGVRAISLREGDCAIGAGIIEPGKQVLVITENGYGKRTAAEEYKQQTRGGIGLKTINITEKTGLMCGILVVDGTEDVMMINDAGVVIRTGVEDISVFGRDTQGVRLMKIEEGDKVVCVETIVEEEEEEEGAVPDEGKAEETEEADDMGENIACEMPPSEEKE
jgi:DNA gyrase subunit A